MNKHLLAFVDGRLQARQDAGEVRLIDSFAVRAGKTIAIDMHMARFRSSLEQYSPSLTTALPSFWQACQLALKDETIFARIELAEIAGQPTLRLRQRPLVNVAPTCRMLVGAAGDPRKQPRMKGPDLALCQAWQARAKAEGCDEYLIRDDQGRPLEGAFSALMWWQDDTLCALPDDAPVLPSVTRDVLLAVARKQSIPTLRYWPTLKALQHTATWLVNARTGPRLAWGDDRHLATFAAWWRNA